MPVRPLADHRLSWAQRKALHERLVTRAAALRTGPGRPLPENEAAELAEIEAATGRIDRADYGTCLDCGAPIAWDRLLAVPQLLRCTRCQALVAPGKPG